MNNARGPKYRYKGMQGKPITLAIEGEIDPIISAIEGSRELLAIANANANANAIVIVPLCEFSRLLSFNISFN